MGLRIELVICLALMASCQPKSDPSAVTASAKLKKSAPVYQSGADVAAHRASEDEQIWAEEVLAQQYEKTFVDLWDTLRAAPDPLAVLAKFPFKTLTVPALGTASDLGAGARAWGVSDEPGTLYNAKAWAAQIGQWHAQTYRLEQSEWHHSTFVAGKDGQPAKSTVSFALHVERISPEARYAVEGKLKVTWATPPSAAGLAQVGTVVVDDFKLIERTGPIAFKETVLHRDPVQPVLPVLVDDLDRDGLPEVLLPGHNLVYRNTAGRLSPEPLFQRPLPKQKGMSRAVGQLSANSAVLGDFNGDGHRDLIVTLPLAPPRIYFGNNGHFKSAPIDIELETEGHIHPSAVASGDIDGDGDLDLWLTQYKEPFTEGQLPTPFYNANDGYPSTLLINDGQGKFTDGTEASGLTPKRYRRTFSASFFDYDTDGDLDLVVVSDFSGVDLYRNDGKGHFTDITKSMPERHTFGMAHAFGDYNLDGRPDLFVTGMSSTTARRLSEMNLGRAERDDIQKMRPLMGYGNRVYLQGDQGYTLAPFSEDVARSGWSWGTVAFDLENDGDPDIYVANGHISGGSASDYCSEYWRHDVYAEASEPDPALWDYFKDSLRRQRESGMSWNGYEHNHLFVNDGGKGFNNLAFAFGLAQEDDARSVAVADFDGDGRQDLLVSVSPSPRSSEFRLLRLQNRIDTKGNWIGFRLEPKAGEQITGTRITVKLSDGTRTLVMVDGDSFLTQNPGIGHLGLGTIDEVKKVVVHWPNGSRSVLESPALSTYHVIR